MRALECHGNVWHKSGSCGMGHGATHGERIVAPLAHCWHPTAVSWFRRPQRFRTPRNGPVILSTVAFMLGVSLSPLCACLCDSGASTDEPPGHSHHESHASPEPAKDHSCGGADCIHLTATLTNSVQPASQLWYMGLQPAAVIVSTGFAILPANLPGALARHHPDRGPPIPPSPLTILRP